MDHDEGDTSMADPIGREVNRGDEAARMDAIGEGPGARTNLN